MPGCSKLLTSIASLNPPANSPRVGLCCCLHFTDEKTEARTVRTSPEGAGSGPSGLFFVSLSTHPSCSSVCARPGQPPTGQARAGLRLAVLNPPRIPLSGCAPWLQVMRREQGRGRRPFPPALGATCRWQKVEGRPWHGLTPQI